MNGQTFREATLHLTAYRHRSFYDGQSSPTKRFGIEDILQRVKKVEHAETDITRHQLLRNGVELINGTARFLPSPDKNMVAVLSNDSYTTATDAKRHSSASICKRCVCIYLSGCVRAWNLCWSVCAAASAVADRTPGYTTL